MPSQEQEEDDYEDEFGDDEAAEVEDADATYQDMMQFEVETPEGGSPVQSPVQSPKLASRQILMSEPAAPQTTEISQHTAGREFEQSAATETRPDAGNAGEEEYYIEDHQADDEPLTTAHPSEERFAIDSVPYAAPTEALLAHANYQADTDKEPDGELDNQDIQDDLHMAVAAQPEPIRSAKSMSDQIVEAEWGDDRLNKAIEQMKAGHYSDAQALAAGAFASMKSIRAEQRLPETKDAFQRQDMFSPATLDAEGEGWGGWRLSMDDLATSLEAAGEPERAEGLYLRMLAWREGVEQYLVGHFGVAEQLFKRSPAYTTIEDATWFLSSLRPDDGHAASEVVPLLVLGEEVAAKAALAVWTLAQRPEQRTRISECGGLELVAKAVSYHVENAELMAAGCGALRLLCAGHEMASRNRRVLISRLGGAEAIAAAMRHHPDDPEVQREACGAMRAASSKYPAGARRIIENDGFMLCLEALTNCPREAVGEVACKAMASFFCAAQVDGEQPDAAEDSHDAWEDQLRERRVEGLQFCQDRLSSSLPAGDRVQLQNLLLAVDVFVEDSVVRQKAVGLIDAVIGCMQRFPGLPKLQGAACSILWRLTCGHPGREDAVRRVSALNGVTPICQATRDLPCHPQVQRLAASALRNICFGHDSNKTLAVRAGGIPATVTAMQRFAKDAKLQEQAIGALTSFCDTVGRAAVCARLGGIEAIVAALRRHHQFGNVAELACIILCMLCDDAQLRLQIVRAGTLTLAKTLSRSGTPEVHKWGCELLRSLSEDHNDGD